MSEWILTTHWTVIRSLRFRVSVGWEAEWPRLCSPEWHNDVILLNSEPWFLFLFFSEYLLCLEPEVSPARYCECEVWLSLTHDEHVRSATERIGTHFDRLEEHFRVVACGLFGRRTVEIPRQQICQTGICTVVDHLGLAAQFHFSAQPNLFSQNTVF